MDLGLMRTHALWDAAPGQANTWKGTSGNEEKVKCEQGDSFSQAELQRPGSGIVLPYTERQSGDMGCPALVIT